MNEKETGGAGAAANPAETPRPQNDGERFWRACKLGAEALKDLSKCSADEWREFFASKPKAKDAP